VVFDLPYEANGYQFEVEEVCNCLREGSTESAIMPLDESVQIMEMMDALRAEMGIRYPSD
jgi:hypothetical protein